MSVANSRGTIILKLEYIMMKMMRLTDPQSPAADHHNVVGVCDLLLPRAEERHREELGACVGCRCGGGVFCVGKCFA